LNEYALLRRGFFVGVFEDRTTGETDEVNIPTLAAKSAARMGHPPNKESSCARRTDEGGCPHIDRLSAGGTPALLKESYEY
jgi:hypothetical protein